MYTVINLNYSVEVVNIVNKYVVNESHSTVSSMRIEYQYWMQRSYSNNCQNKSLFKT